MIIKEKKNNNMKHVVISLSGGMDSSTLLMRCLKKYDTVTALSFDYGQKHKVEIDKAESLVRYLNSCSEKTEIDALGTITITGKNYSPIIHRVIKLEGLSDLLNSTLVEGGDDVPEGFYEEENQKDTVVPNRNKIFSSIVQAVALSISGKTGESCDIALGIHAGDHAIYPDCRQEFRDADDTAFRLGNWGAERVRYFTPYLLVSKEDILRDGKKLCNDLGLDFTEVYSRTITSYKPIYIEGEMRHTVEGMRNRPEGEWYSDYKSASSVERILAFDEIGEIDPVKYADETGPVSWKTVVKHAKNVREEYWSKIIPEQLT